MVFKDKLEAENSRVLRVFEIKEPPVPVIKRDYKTNGFHEINQQYFIKSFDCVLMF